ncbi:Aldo/keto reductase [Russula ochroleuca]|jgi:glycerol 2-dehydrogenase (NADP+)|uniref:Aldo/keto reductase n=1 Tax=Russula ochroleuca TaxID=152965 RepID=A0A9P5N1E8_9AGAM|nr:Aldo/keto reductase [Russula ochroleuca]
MPIQKVTKLNTGAIMPHIGLGTWKSQPGKVEHAVETALKNGYRHIDTATAYDNEKQVGEGIKASGVSRSEIFLTTKLNNNDHKDVLGALNKSLGLLGTEYVDLYLLHWPAPMTNDWKADKSLNWHDTWKKIEKVYREHPEKVKAIGVSNVSAAYLKDLLALPDVIVPAVNQVERHPSCLEEEVLAACEKAGIVITAYSPLGSDQSPLLKNDVVLRLAEKYNITPANVLVSFQVNTPNVNVLPKSVTPERIIGNLKVVDLTEEEIAELKGIDKANHFRACPPTWTGWGNLGFTD